MKRYLVGGAVRDNLLGLSVKERDWVLVGAKAEDLIAQGYKQVGSDFPVFLHPDSHEEYAMARKERKSAPGYHGFECDSGKEVTLLEDLSRRDLTINAIAMDEEGTLIDPYHGQDDLSKKILRHVTSAFIEDPLRVLRLARFKARYHYLGFKVDESTLQLVRLMVASGELNHLVAERVWQEWQKSLMEANPEQFILVLRQTGALQVVLPELDSLFGIPDKLGTVDVGFCSLQALVKVSKQTEDSVLRFSVLTYALGKSLTPIAKWPCHKGYGLSGEQAIHGLCARLKIPLAYRKLATKLARWHDTLCHLDDLNASEVIDVLYDLDAFRDRDFFNKVLLASESVFATEQGSQSLKAYPNWQVLLNACLSTDAKAMIAQGCIGPQISDFLKKTRIELIRQILNH